MYDFETFERVKAVFVASWRMLQHTLDLNSVFSPIVIQSPPTSIASAPLPDTLHASTSSSQQQQSSSTQETQEKSTTVCLKISKSCSSLDLCGNKIQTSSSRGGSSSGNSAILDAFHHHEVDTNFKRSSSTTAAVSKNNGKSLTAITS